MIKWLHLLIIALLAGYVLGDSDVEGTLEGTYQPATGSEQCVSSSTCCCSTGTTTISSEPPNTQVTVNGDLDGGTGCRGFKSLSAVFETLNSTAATWTVPMYGDKYVAVADSTYSTLRVERQDSTGCTNILYRVSGSATPSNGSGSNSSTNTTNSNNSTSSNGNNSSNSNTTSNGIGTGNFQALTTPVIMGDNTTEGYFQVDSSYKAWYAVLATSSNSDTYEIWLILEPSSSMFNSIQGSYAYVHYISPTTSDPNTAASANPITAKMTAQDASSTSRQFKYESVRVPNGLGMRFSFSYALSGGSNVNSDTFFFKASGIAGTTNNSSSSSGSNSSSSGSLSQAQIQQYHFVGTYEFDSSKCTSSSQCCCAIGSMTAKENSDASKISLESTLDGSSACNGMSSVAGDFEIESTTTATYAYPDTPLTMKAEMSSDYKTLTFSNSIYTCTSTATRTSGDPTKYDNGGSSSGSSTNSNSNSNSTSLGYRDKFVGTWASDGSCSPNTSCCCLTGSMHVVKPSDATGLSDYEAPDDTSLMSNPNALYAKGNLDGGVACFRKTSMSGTCLIDNPSFGSCTLQGITFNATLLNDDKVSITNSMYQNCDSVIVRTSHDGLASYAPPTFRPFSFATILTYSVLGMLVILTFFFFDGRM